MPRRPRPATRLIDWFIPPNAGWTGIELRRARLFVTGYVFGPLFALLLALALQRAEDPLSIAYWAFVAIAVGLFAFPVALRLTGAYDIVSVAGTLYTTAMIFFMTYNYGGWISPALPTTIIMPVAAYFFLPPRGRIICLGALVAGFVALTGLHFSGHAFPVRVPEEMLADLFMITVFAAGTYVAMMTGTLVSLFNDAEQKLHEEIRKHEITERKLERAKEDSESASRAKSDFLANMSHELRTPLNAIIGFSEMMMAETFGPLGSRKYGSYVHDIHSSGRHLLDLVSDILDLSKIESGKDAPEETLIDVPRLLAAVVPLVKGRADEGRVKLGTDIPDGLPRLRADSRKLKQILVNLLSNAVKFTEPGGSVNLSVSVRGDDGITFHVVDTGVGMAARDIPTALSQFGQVDNELSGNNEGTGIGLPLTGALVEQHGGVLALASEVGAGTTVTVDFPAVRTVRFVEDETRRSLRKNANPSEMRRIVFTHDEVLVALSRYAAGPPDRRENSRFVTCRILRSPRLRVFAELESHDGGPVQEIEVDAHDVAEALLRYCAASGVPIPLRADKELEVIGENLSLNLRIETATEPVIGRLAARQKGLPPRTSAP